METQINTSEETQTMSPFLRLNESTKIFIQDRIQLFANGVSGQDLQKKLHIPFLQLPLPFFDYNIMLREAQKIEHLAVGHRSKDSHGWKSICLHGIDATKTLSSDRYGYSSETEAPYVWTEVAPNAPETKRFLDELLKLNYFEKFYRVRFMYLEPGGKILFHRDRDEQNKSLGPLNIALNMPIGCHWVFEEWGTVPFEPGTGYAVDVSNRHGVWNFSNQTRVHMILHGKYGPQYYKSIEEAVRNKKSLYQPKTKDLTPLKKTENSSVPFDCILWHRNNEIYIPELLTKCSNITEHFVRLKANRQHRVSSGVQLSHLLSRSLQSGAKWAFVCTPGNLFKDGFFSSARNLLSQLDENIFMVAHLLDRGDRWYGLHPQSFFINLEIWEKLGRPSFGGDAEKQDLPAVLRSQENVHDNYTPLFLKRSPGFFNCKPQIFGWNWIKSALQSEFELINFPTELRDKKLFLYPEQNQQILIDRINHIHQPLENLQAMGQLSAHQEEVFESLHIESYGAEKKIFLFNTEQVRSPYQEGRIKKIDLYFGLPAGFMDLHLLDRHKTNENAQLVYFDINQSMLEIKKELFESWDGHDFLSFWKNLEKQRPDLFFDKLMTVNPQDIQLRWEEELSIWGGGASFKKGFEQAKQLHKTYLHCDIITSQYRILEELSKYRNKHVAFWYSNCFNYTPSLALNDWSMQRLRESGIALLNTLSRLAKVNNLHITLYGEDVVEGYKVPNFGTDIHHIFG